MKRIIFGIGQHLRHGGIRNLLRDCIAALRPEVYRILLLEGSPKGTLIPPDGFLFDTDIEKFRRLRNLRNDLPSDFYRDQQNPDQPCFFAECGAGLAGVNWTRDCSGENRFLALCSSDIEVASLWVLAEFTGRGLATALTYYELQELYAKGHRRFYGVYRESVVASRRAFLHCGAKELAHIRRPALFGPLFLCAEGRFESWTEMLRRFVGFGH